MIFFGILNYNLKDFMVRHELQCACMLPDGSSFALGSATRSSHKACTLYYFASPRGEYFEFVCIKEMWVCKVYVAEDILAFVVVSTW